MGYDKDSYIFAIVNCHSIFPCSKKTNAYCWLIKFIYNNFYPTIHAIQQNYKNTASNFY
jgi:hypothetical protein